MPNEFVCKINTDGKLEFIYNDQMTDLLDEGASTIRRASYVEPGADGRWYADMSPIASDRVLGPYKLRSTALAAEIEFLKQEVFS